MADENPETFEAWMEMVNAQLNRLDPVKAKDAKDDGYWHGLFDGEYTPPEAVQAVLTNEAFSRLSHYPE